MNVYPCHKVLNGIYFTAYLAMVLGVLYGGGV